MAKLRDPSPKGLILLTCGTDVLGTSFGSTLIGLEICGRYHWGGSKWLRDTMATLWPGMICSASPPESVANFVADIRRRWPFALGLLVGIEAAWVDTLPDGWCWLKALLKDLEAVDGFMMANWLWAPAGKVDPPWWSVSQITQRAPRILSLNSQNFANLFPPGVWVWSSWELAPCPTACHDKMSAIAFAKLGGAQGEYYAGLYPGMLHILKHSGKCEISNMRGSLCVSPSSILMGRILVDCLVGLGLLNDAPSTLELMDWWWTVVVSKAGECCSAKTLRSCAGPWGRLVVASHWGEEEKLEHSLPLAPNLGDDELAAALVVSLLRRSDSRGSDIRLDTGVPFVARAWPRVTVDPQRWRWQTCRAWEFKKPQHINELELQALVGLMKWRGRRLDSFGKRF